MWIVGEAMLKVVQDVYEGCKEHIPGWKLLSDARDSLQRGGPDGLKAYYARCLDLNDPQGRWVKETLERNGCSTLESEHNRFLAAYRSGLN